MLEVATIQYAFSLCRLISYAAFIQCMWPNNKPLIGRYIIFLTVICQSFPHRTIHAKAARSRIAIASESSSFWSYPTRKIIVDTRTVVIATNLLLFSKSVVIAQNHTHSYPNYLQLLMNARALQYTRTFLMVKVWEDWLHWRVRIRETKGHHSLAV